MSKPSLTESLMSDSQIDDLYKRTIRNGFLRLGGRGRLPRKTLSEWLSQDRLYAQAYARFIGGLISRLPLPTGGEADEPSTTKTLEWRILVLLQKALEGIIRELQLFEETAAKYNLDLNTPGVGEFRFGPNATTQGYIQLLNSFAANAPAHPTRTLFDGLAVLWATEKVYLDSWTYAKEFQGPVGSGGDQDGGAVREKFIPNWTSPEFQEFVKEAEECLDAYEQNLTGEENEDARFVKAAEMLKKVLVLEEGFWPVTSDEDDSTYF
ncbi:heme oxygenase-like protein [Poronia punctata]|nr:heme oxygenase-like protein [Poronia punctata]